MIQAEARGRCSKPNIVFHFAAEGERITRQEEDRNCNGRPDRLTLLDPQGNPSFRCTPREVDEFEGGVATLSLEDSSGDGYADRRQIFEAGVPARLEADTNGDRRTDVWISYVGGQARTQDEDTNFDGQIDQRFDLATEQAQKLNGGGESPSQAPFERIRCEGFSEFWQR